MRNAALVLALFLACALPSRAILNCADCDCTRLCSATCFTDTGSSTCGAQGVCSGSSGCSSCLTTAESASRVDLFGGGRNAVLPIGPRHGQAVARLTWRLSEHVEGARLGAVFSAETGFLIPARTPKLKAPDLAFVSRERLPESKAPAGFLRGSPDLVAEVLPATAFASAMEKDAQKWLGAGTRAVLLIDPDQETVTVYRSRSDMKTLGAGDTLELPDIVPGWQLSISELFE